MNLNLNVGIAGRDDLDSGSYEFALRPGRLICSWLTELPAGADSERVNASPEWLASRFTDGRAYFM
jgi:hypothetical protein